MKVILLSLLIYIVSSSCPNLCSHHGSCSTNGLCNCYPGWTEGDCSGRTCPFGEPYADTQEHEESRYIECSGQGTCDRTTGLCQCFDGFGGSACHRTLCENNCNFHGLCLPVTHLGINNDNYLNNYYYYTGKKANDKYESWDEDQSYQCVCDEEYTGYDCSLKKCATGYKQTSDCDAPAEYYQKIAFGGIENTVCPATYKNGNDTTGTYKMSGCLAYAKYTDQLNRTWITKPFNIFANLTDEWDTDTDNTTNNDKYSNYVDKVCFGLDANGQPNDNFDKKDAINEKSLSDYPSLYQALKMLPPGTIDLKSVKVSPPSTSGTSFTINIEYGSQQTGRQQPLEILTRKDVTFNCVQNLLEPLPSYFTDTMGKCYTSDCKDKNGQDDDPNKCATIAAETNWARDISSSDKYITYLENVVFNNVDTIYVPPLECANNGLCNRQTGLCECFTGYYGLACTEASPIQ